MHHAAAEDLQPVLARADLQFPALAAAADVDFGARLGEGEVAGPEAQRQVLDSEEGPAEGGQRTLQVPHVAFLVDHHPLDLTESRRVRGIVFGTEGPPRREDADRWLLGPRVRSEEHTSDLP